MSFQNFAPNRGASSKNWLENPKILLENAPKTFSKITTPPPTPTDLKISNNYPPSSPHSWLGAFHKLVHMICTIFLGRHTPPHYLVIITLGTFHLNCQMTSRFFRFWPAPPTLPLYPLALHTHFLRILWLVLRKLPKFALNLLILEVKILGNRNFPNYVFFSC